MNTGGVLLLVVGVLSVAAVINARWPRQGPGLRTIIYSWFLAMIVVEVAPHLLVIGAVLIVVNATLLDGLGNATGWAGVILWALAAIVALPYGDPDLAALDRSEDGPDLLGRCVAAGAGAFDDLGAVVVRDVAWPADEAADDDLLGDEPLNDPADPLGPPAGDTLSDPTDPLAPPVDPTLDNDPALDDALTPDASQPPLG